MKEEKERGRRSGEEVKDREQRKGKERGRQKREREDKIIRGK